MVGIIFFIDITDAKEGRFSNPQPLERTRSNAGRSFVVVGVNWFYSGDESLDEGGGRIQYSCREKGT